jgi:hypothetical protein
MAHDLHPHPVTLAQTRVLACFHAKRQMSRLAPSYLAKDEAKNGSRWARAMF